MNTSFIHESRIEHIENQENQSLIVERAGYYACRLTDHSPFHVFIVGFTPLVWCPNSELVASLRKPLKPIVCTIQSFPLPVTSWAKQNDRGHGYIPIKQYFLKEMKLGMENHSVKSCYLPHTRKRRHAGGDGGSLVIEHHELEHDMSHKDDGGYHTRSGEIHHDKHSGFTFHVTLEFDNIQQSCIGRYILEASNCFKTPTHQLNQFTLLVQDSRGVFYSIFALVSEILMIIAIFYGFRKDIKEANNEEIPERREAVVKKKIKCSMGRDHNH